MTTIKEVKNSLAEWALPTMLELADNKWAGRCGSECVVRIGHPPDEELAESCDFNFSTFWLRPDSQPAVALGVEDGDWLFLRPGEGRWSAIGKKNARTVKQKWKRRKQLQWLELPMGFAFP
jgi:hypothetical protein